MRTISGRGIAPSQTIAIDKDNPTQHTPIIDTRLSVRLRKERFQTRHLRVAKPKKIAHVTAPLSEP